MATQNSIGNKGGYLSIDPGVSGDSFVQFNINNTGEFRIGVDDSDTQSFKFSQGSALGTNDRFKITQSGERLLASQPAFLVYLTSVANAVTGDGTEYTIAWNGVIFDQSGDFSANTFTAPVSGRYRFSCNIFYNDLLITHTSSNVKIDTSNRTYFGCTQDLGVMTAGFGDQTSAVLAVLADMDAGDTCVNKATVSNGTKVVDIFSVSITDFRANFSGSLVC